MGGARPPMFHAVSSQGTAIESLTMNKLLLKLAVTVTVGGLLAFNPTIAQILPPAKKARRVKITKKPALELARENSAIIRWTTNNPGGTDVHFAVIHYGTNRSDLSRMAKSQIRINRAHPETIFRVRVGGLKPRTTYYYRVTSMESNGKSDGVKSSVSQFTTPGPGEQIVLYPPHLTKSK
jgi:phosphodiesterase/alkaline phosphatase D-like protein